MHFLNLMAVGRCPGLVAIVLLRRKNSQACQLEDVTKSQLKDKGEFRRFCRELTR